MYKSKCFKHRVIICRTTKLVSNFFLMADVGWCQIGKVQFCFLKPISFPYFSFSISNTKSFCSILHCITSVDGWIFHNSLMPKHWKIIPLRLVWNNENAIRLCKSLAVNFNCLCKVLAPMWMRLTPQMPFIQLKVSFKAFHTEIWFMKWLWAVGLISAYDGIHRIKRLFIKRCIEK